jgi:Glyoxalase/Bleomycin resistance protein/Dioxygenase superfamily
VPGGVVAFRGVTPTIDELMIADDPATWEELGFTIDAGVCRLGTVDIRLAGRGAGEGIVSWSVRELASAELDGLPTTVSTRPPSAPGSEHPNGVLAIDHIVAVSPDFPRSVRALEQAGLDLRRVREEPTPAGAPRQAFFRLGNEILELVQEPQEALARRGGPQRPAHFWGLAMIVADLDATLERLAEHSSPPRAAVQPHRRIATLKRSAGLAVPLALITPKEEPLVSV